MSGRGLVLTGFMGAGKTTLAQALAARLNCRWLDLDEVITARTGRLVPDIILRDGEEQFREIETAALQDLLADGTVRVMGLGGGAWTLARNRALAQRYNALSVWLDTPFALCWQRITGQNGVRRPLAADLAATKSLYEKRLPLYAQAEMRLIVGPTDSPDALAARVIEQGNLLL